MSSPSATGRAPDGSRAPPAFERIALLLQGGGALGAYQAGVYQALAEADLHPDWVAGISIGAINSALIAGNPPEKRVRRPRDLGIPEEARQSEGLPRERDAALHPALRLGALRHRHHGLQALRARSRAAA
jgi:predicted acylesterase/phospholipase RssA